MKSPIQEMQNIVAFACTEQLSSESESLCYNLISFPVVFLLDRNLLDYCMYLRYLGIYSLHSLLGTNDYASIIGRALYSSK